jgi:hypothetical protein
MSRNLALGQQMGGRGWMISPTVELLARRRVECLELEARVRRARRQLGSTRSGELQEALVDIEADLGTYAGLLAEREACLGWAGQLPVLWGGGSSDDGVPLDAAITEFVRRSRGEAPEAERLGDLESAAVLAEIARVAETWLWGLAAAPGHLRLARQPYMEGIR